MIEFSKINIAYVGEIMPTIRGPKKYRIMSHPVSDWILC